MVAPQQRLSDLKNIGPTTEQWLHDIGVTTPDELRALGAVTVWRRLKAAYRERVTIVGLYALHGALTDTHWNELAPEIKAALRAAAREKH